MYDVVTCRPHAPLDLTIIDECITGYPVHWVEEERVEQGKKVLRRRTRLCTPCGTCVHCGKAPDAVWVGYVGGYVHKEKKLQIALLSPAAGRKLNGMRVPFTGIRGLRVTISRRGDRARGEMDLGKSLHEPLAVLPLAFPLSPTLRVVFGCWRLPDELSEGEDPPAGDIPLPRGPVDDRVAWEREGGAS
jgi:hypothetical protein